MPLPRPWLAYLLVASALLGWALGNEVQQNGELCPPLDDSFIHFQYARTLAAGDPGSYGEPGVYTSGASSLLWPVLLAPGVLGGLKGLGLYLWALVLSLGLWVGAAELVRRTWAERDEVDAFLAGFVVVASGPLLWGAASGMEVPLMACALAGFLRANLNGSTPEFIGWGLALASTRPEGALVVGAAGLARIRAPSDVWRLAVSLPGAVQPLLNLALTGAVLSGSVAAKGNPRFFQASEYSELGVLWENYVLGGYGEQFFGMAGVPCLALFAYGLWTLPRRGADRLDPRLLLAVCWLLPLCLDVFVMRSPSQGARYLLPGLVIFLPVAAMAVRRGPGAWAIAPLALVLVGQIGTWSQRLASDAREVLTADVGMARFVAAYLPAGQTVAGNDVGALAYLGGHRLVDLEGLVTPAALPYALEGGAGVFHYVERTRPDLVVFFPEWFPGFLDTGLLEPVAAVQIPEPKAIGGPVLVAARPNPSAFSSRLTPPPLGPNERVLDALDEGDPVDERAHGWSAAGPGGLFGRAKVLRGRASAVVLGDWPVDPTPADPRVVRPVVDSLRRHHQMERFDMSGTSPTARLVARLGPSNSPQTLRVTWGDQSREITVPVITGWHVLTVDLGPITGEIAFAIEHISGPGGVTGGWAPAHWWLVGG